ncbi:MAG: type IV conjugative transfer system protein TraL [bacterium]
MEFKRIPKYIDSPIQILWWETQEGAIIAFLMFATIIVMHQALYGAVVGIIIASKYAKFKENNVKGYFTHFVYWFGFLNVQKNIKPYQKLIIR